MPLLWKFSVILILLAANLPAKSADQVAKGSAESWVEFVDIPPADNSRSTQIRNGIYNLISEYQVKHRDGGYSLFDRNVYKIVERPGLESGAKIDLEFDPSRHTVRMVRLQIIRDGVILDRLADARFDLFRRERDAERGIFDGWLTAHLDLEDVRVGDIIDYATTTEVAPIVGDKLFFHGFAVEWEEPVALIRRKIIWPRTQLLEIRNFRTEAQPNIEADGDMSVHLWEIRNPAPIRSEENVPVGYRTRGGVEVSSTADWEDIAEAVRPHYQTVQTFPQPFAGKLDLIASKYPMPADRLTEALRLVQDEIRYVSLSIGAGSYIPRRPETVVTSGFGDCKDKALLLASALRRLGIEAYVALTDIDEGRGLDRELPSLTHFDHAIVKARIGEQTYWLDATDYLQGGRASNLVTPDYGFALPLVASEAKLERIEPKAPPGPTTDVAESFVFPKQDGDPLLLSVHTIYKDRDADWMRRKLAGESIAKLGGDYVQYYAKQYPGIASTSQLTAKDDRDANVLSIEEAYMLPAAALLANDLAKKFPVKADVGSGNLPVPTAVDRLGPIALGAPVNRRHTVVVSNLKAQFVGPENASVVTPYASLQISSRSEPTELEIEWRFNTMAAEVPAKEIAGYLASVDNIGRNTEWSYDFTFSDAGSRAPDVATGTVIATLVLLASALVILGIAIHEASRSVPPSDQQYLPISAGKFLAMSLLTYGFYSILWAWRAFWQQKARHGGGGWPFWRALFLPIWLIPAFLDANGRLSAKRLPQWLGIGAAVSYLAFWIGSSVAGYTFESLSIWWYAADIVIPSIAPLPLVVAVDRLNSDAPENLVRNSRLTVWDGLGALLGVSFTCSTIYLQYNSVA